MYYFSDLTVLDVWNKYFSPERTNLVLLVCFITSGAKVVLHLGFGLSEIIIAIHMQGRFNKICYHQNQFQNFFKICGTGRVFNNFESSQSELKIHASL